MFTRGMYLGTVDEIAVFSDWLKANLCFIIIRMVLTLMPPMTEKTLKSLAASVLIDANRFCFVPLFALFCRVQVDLGLSTEVLPIVSIDTSLPIVGRVDKGTPHCLVVECVKVCIESKLADQINTHFSFIVSEGAVLSIITKTGG